MKSGHHRDEIKNHLIQLKEEEIRHLEKLVGIYKGDADLDEEAVIDVDDLSHQNQSTESARTLYSQLEEARSQLETFRKIVPGDSLLISGGAIVITNRVNFVIGLSFKDFEWEGQHFIGISTDAPVFSVLEGKRVGDSLNFKGVDYIIKEIL